MKKLLIIVAAIALIAILAVGTSAFAKGGEENPVEQWQGLMNLLNGSVTKMETGSGQIESVIVNTNIGFKEFIKDNNSIRHVSLTYRAMGLNTANLIVIGGELPFGTGTQFFPIYTVDGGGEGLVRGSVEFDAIDWKIQLWDYDVEGQGQTEQSIKMSFVYTETYPK